MKPIRYAAMAALLAAVSAIPAAAATFEDGLSLKESRNYDEAIKVFREITEGELKDFLAPETPGESKEPRSAAAFEQLAIMLGWTGDYDGSASAWRQAIRIEPGNLSYHLGLARTLYWKGDRTAAMAELQPVLDKDPSNKDALLLAGDLALADGNVETARDHYERARAAHPEDSAIRVKLDRLPHAFRWRFDLGVNADRYSKLVYRGWENGNYLQISYTAVPGKLLLSAGFDRYYRFHDNDFRFNLFALVQPAKDLTLTGSAAFSPSPLFLARQDYRIEGEYLIGGLVAPLVGFRFADIEPRFASGAHVIPYPVDSNYQYIFGFKAYPAGWVHGEFRVLVTDSRVAKGVLSCSASPATELALGICGGDEVTLTYQTRIGFTVREDWHPYVSFAYGEENTPPIGVTPAVTVGTGLYWQIVPAAGARLDYFFERRRDPSGGPDAPGFTTYYLLNSVNLGLTFKM